MKIPITVFFFLTAGSGKSHHENNLIKIGIQTQVTIIILQTVDKKLNRVKLVEEANNGLTNRMQNMMIG